MYSFVVYSFQAHQNSILFITPRSFCLDLPGGGDAAKRTAKHAFATTLTWFPVFAGVMVVLLFTGLKDDILGLSAKKKLLIEVLSVGAIILIGGVIIQDFGGLFGIGVIPYWAAVLFTGFVIIVLTNAYNLIDGVDGVSGWYCFIASFSFSLWFFAAGFNAHAILCLALAGAHIRENAMEEVTV